MNRQRAVFAIHIAAVLFGLTGIFGELIQADAMVITAGRAGFAVLALLAVMRSRRSSPLLGITRTNIWVLAMAGSMLAVHWVTFFLAVKIRGVAVATLGFASFPARSEEPTSELQS